MTSQYFSAPSGLTSERVVATVIYNKASVCIVLSKTHMRHKPQLKGKL